jgi:hypothetical protein
MRLNEEAPIEREAQSEALCRAPGGINGCLATSAAGLWKWNDRRNAMIVRD